MRRMEKEITKDQLEEAIKTLEAYAVGVKNSPFKPAVNLFFDVGKLRENAEKLGLVKLKNPVFKRVEDKLVQEDSKKLDKEELHKLGKEFSDKFELKRIEDEKSLKKSFEFLKELVKEDPGLLNSMKECEDLLIDEEVEPTEDKIEQIKNLCAKESVKPIQCTDCGSPERDMTIPKSSSLNLDENDRDNMRKHVVKLKPQNELERLCLLYEEMIKSSLQNEFVYIVALHKIFDIVSQNKHLLSTKSISDIESYLIWTNLLITKKQLSDDVLKTFNQYKSSSCFIPGHFRERDSDNKVLALVESIIDSLEKYLKNKVNKLSLSQRVTFLGYIPHKDMPKYLHESDIFIRPSLSEGFGNSFIEAMAARIPVIATPVGGIVDFLKDGETGLFCEVKNPRSIAQKVEKLLKDKESHDYIVRNAYEMVKSRYDWSIIANDMKNKVFLRII